MDRQISFLPLSRSPGRAISSAIASHAFLTELTGTSAPASASRCGKLARVRHLRAVLLRLRPAVGVGRQNAGLAEPLPPIGRGVEVVGGIGVGPCRYAAAQEVQEVRALGEVRLALLGRDRCAVFPLGPKAPFEHCGQRLYGGAAGRSRAPCARHGGSTGGRGRYDTMKVSAAMDFRRSIAMHYGPGRCGKQS